MAELYPTYAKDGSNKLHAPRANDTFIDEPDVSFDNISDLTDYKIGQSPRTKTANVMGYYSAGDGGGGTFYWDGSEDKANHNGGTIINPDHNSTIGSANWYSATGDGTSTTGSGCWVRPDIDVVNVKWFGAKGDGINDDYYAINNSIISNKDILLPEGNYLVNTPIEKTSVNDLSLLGLGQAKINSGSGINSGTYIPAGGGLYLSGKNIKVENITFEGYESISITDSTKSNSHLLEFNSVDNGIITNCKFINGNSGGIELTGNCKLININKNDFNNVNFYVSDTAVYGAIDIAGSSEFIYIENNNILNSHSAGVSIRDNNKNIWVKNNRIESKSADDSISNSMGVYTISKPDSEYNLNIVGNYFNKIAYECVYIEAKDTFNYDGILVKDNYCFNWTRNAIIVKRKTTNTSVIIKKCRIINNYVKGKDGGYAGTVNSIYIRKVSESAIKDNVIVGTDKINQIGFNIDSVSKINWVGNEVYNCSIGFNGLGNDSIFSENRIDLCDNGVIPVSSNFSVVGNNVFKDNTTNYNFSLATNYESIKYIGDSYGDAHTNLPHMRASRRNSYQSDVTGDGTSVIPIFNTVLYDRGLSDSSSGNYDDTTGRYTAPFNGIYQIEGALSLRDLTSSHTSGIIKIFVGSRGYLIWSGNPWQVSNNGIFGVPFSLSPSVTVSNDIYVEATISGGTKVVDVDAGLITNEEDTWFMVRYVK